MPVYAKGQHLKAVDLKLFEQVKAEVVSVSRLASAFSVLTRHASVSQCCHLLQSNWLAATITLQHMP